MNKCTIKKQRGAETLEFLVVFLMFLMLLMGVFESARALYVWNALAEATRRGARMAVVCPFDSASQEIIKKVATFDVIDGNLNSSPVVKGLTTDAFDITYYDSNGDVVDVTGKWEDVNGLVEFASVEVNNNYKFKFFIPGMSFLEESVPTFKTILFSESDGMIPHNLGEPEITPSCKF